MTDKLLIEALENCKAALASADPVRFHWEVTQATKAIAAHRSQQEAAKEPISLPEMQATGKRERAAFMGEFGNSSEEYRAWAWQGWQARAARAGKASTLMEAAAARVAAMSEDEYAEKVRDAASHPLSKINQDTEMNTIHSMTLDSLADDLGRLLMEEDLQDEKLREASEDLLPRLHDTIRKHLNELKRPGMTPGGAQVALQDVNFVPAASAAPSESEAKDAARYRWLKDHSDVTFHEHQWFFTTQGQRIHSTSATPDELDDAIDAAMAASGQKEEPT